ncbi:MAG: hypothetical protein JRH20_19300, partial [Deltaproteobacteria bacterium]|nr:hypothetical protein [Deltaproteobacteria bacterium]
MRPSRKHQLNKVRQKLKAKRPQLGLNMHPRWLNGKTLKQFVSALRSSGLSYFEWALNPKDPSWREAVPLIVESNRLGMKPVFHLPYKGEYIIAGFSSSRQAELKRLYRPLLRFASHFASKEEPVTLVIHGAEAENDRSSLTRDTSGFLKWVSSTFDRVQLSLENLPHKKNLKRIGDYKSELVSIVSKLRSPKVGICWDLGHDAVNHSIGNDSAGFLSRV